MFLQASLSLMAVPLLSLLCHIVDGNKSLYERREGKSEYKTVRKREKKKEMEITKKTDTTCFKKSTPCYYWHGNLLVCFKLVIRGKKFPNTRTV